MAMAENLCPLLSSSPPPSSPTHLASLRLQEHPLLRSSPPPPPPKWASPPLAYNSSSSRKRQSHHLLPTEDSLLSSDPAYFSSDDIANASAENYTVERKKRRYRGCWWEHHQHHNISANTPDESLTGTGEISVSKQQQQQPKSKGFSRNFDSGVWMGSDDSEEQLDNGEVQTQEDENVRQNFSLPQYRYESLSDLKGLCDFDDKREQRFLKLSKGMEANNQRLKDVSAEEELAREIIASCLERGETSIDLSYCNLKSISSETLRPLHQLIRMPLATFEAPVEEAYRPLKPTIRLFFGTNGLSELPSELWNLQNLGGLSLRNNNLKILSPSIARLKSLDSLNVSANMLRYLPWELLSLLCPTGKLRQCSLAVNTFSGSRGWKVVTEDWYKWKTEYEQDLLRNILPKERYNRAASSALYFLTSTPAAYFGKNGQPSSRSKQKPYSQLARDESAPEIKFETPFAYRHTDDNFTDQESDSQCNDISRVPSLFELSLRSVAANCETLPSSSFLTDLNSSSSFISSIATAGIETSFLPPAVKAGLDKVRQLWNDGGRNCSVCQRLYIDPHSEWLEIWCDSTKSPSYYECQKPFYPFLRTCCGCIDPVDTFALGKAYFDRQWIAVSRHDQDCPPMEIDEENV